MKKTAILIFAAAGMLAAASCNKALTPAEMPENTVWTTVVEAAKGPDTKALAYEGAALVASWATTDNVYVLAGSESKGVMHPQSAAETAVLSGTLTGTFTVGDELKLRYPVLEPKYDTQEGTLEFLAENCDVGEATVTVTSVDTENKILTLSSAKFEPQQSIVQFEAHPIVKTLVISTPGLDYNITVTPTDLSTNLIYVAIPEHGSDKQLISFFGKGVDDKTRIGVSAAKSVNGKFYRAPLQMDEVRSVDLGLSVLWSESNLGADIIFEGDKRMLYGQYYAWGETVPKLNYAGSTYKFWSGDAFTKYTGSDGLPRLEAEDDAAQVLLGEGWRMPTRAEVEELALTNKQYRQKVGIDESTYTGPTFEWNYQKFSGSEQYLGFAVTSSITGKTIILPFTSLYTGEELYSVSTSLKNILAIWTSDLSAENPKNAYTLFSDLYPQETMTTSHLNRFWGLPIHPVKDK